MRIVAVLGLAAGSCLGQPWGVWRMNPARSTAAADPRLKSLTVRFEQHAKGEVCTVERIETDGRTTIESSILYLDGKPRDFADHCCSGTQSSWRLDAQTIEILRT